MRVQYDWGTFDIRPSIGVALTVEGPMKRLVFWTRWKDIYVPVDSPLFKVYIACYCPDCGEPIPRIRATT